MARAAQLSKPLNSLFKPKSHVRVTETALGESVNLLIPLLKVAALNKPFSAFLITLLFNWPIEPPLFGVQTTPVDSVDSDNHSAPWFETLIV